MWRWRRIITFCDIRSSGLDLNSNAHTMSNEFIFGKIAQRWIRTIERRSTSRQRQIGRMHHKRTQIHSHTLIWPCKSKLQRSRRDCTLQISQMKSKYRMQLGMRGWIGDCDYRFHFTTSFIVLGPKCEILKLDKTKAIDVGLRHSHFVMAAI